ncbi:MAG: secretin N-terminal domain-containing protein [Fimbriimonadaceae bacterium]
MAHRFFSRLAACLAALAVVGAAPAQFDFGNAFASTPPWEQFKLDPKKTLKLEFRGASIDMVVALLSKASGVTIVKDPGLSGQLTVSTPKAVPLSEAFSIVNSALGLKNAEIVKEGNHLVVRQRPQRGGRGGGQDAGGMPQGFDFSRMAEMFRQPELELKVYPIKYANAAQVARVVNDVFAMQAGNQPNPFQMFMQMGQQGQQGGPFGRGRFGGGFPGFGGGQQRGGTVRASSDDYSNSVIVNATRREHEQVEEIIKQIDQPTEAPMRSQVFKLQYANAQDIAPVVQNVLISNAPKGRGGTGTQQVPFEQRFGAFMRLGGNAQAAFGSVVAETRTNSVVVTATEENLKLVELLVKELDQPVEYAETTFVFPLLNARADQISTILNQTFGGRATGTGNFGQRANTGITRNQTTNRRTNNAGGAGGAGGLGGGAGRAPQSNSEDPNFLELALQDPESDGGELQTQIGFQGGFFGGQFGQRTGTQTRQQGQGTARDEEGRLINVRDLTGQVSVIPDPNTNSLIVVTNPDNVDLLKRILEQLDRIPEQVMIETIIVEASLDTADKLGVEWTFTERNAFGSAGQTAVGQQRFGLQNANPPLEGLRYTMTGGNLEAFLNMLKTDQRFEVLSTPRIFTSNNSTAEINISQSVPYVLSSRVDTNGNISYNYAFQDVGIILNVTPRITADGYVTMDIVQTANDLQGFTSFNAPIVNQRQANTTVAVKDGETVILGGIIRSTVTATTKKIPLLGDIPFLGNLFRSTDRSKQKTELLVFLTPRVVRNPEDAKKLQEQQRSGFSEPTRKALDKIVGPAPTTNGPGGGSQTRQNNDSNKGGTN